MGSVHKLSIALTEELSRDIDAAVAAGDYATASEVVRDALRAWRHAREQSGVAIERLRALWSEGLDSGTPVDGNFDADDIGRRGRARITGPAWDSE